MHVLVADAPLPAPAGVVHGPGGAGHPVAVVAGVGRVVGPVAAVVVVVVAADREKSQEELLRLEVALAPSLAAKGQMSQWWLPVSQLRLCFLHCWT